MVLLSGCSFSAGISVHSPNLDNPEIQLNPVLGIMRAEHHNKNLSYFCEHISAITQKEQGAGLNHCGVLIKLK